jgi:pectate lyase
MKRHIHTTIIYGAAMLLMMLMPYMAVAQTWDFSYVSDADKANLAADAAGWEHELSSSNDRYKNRTTYAAEPLRANGAELEFTKGLAVTADVADAVRVDIKGKRMAMNKVMKITISGLRKGMTLTMDCKTSSKTAARGINATNLTPVSGYFGTTTIDDQTNVGTVTEDGDVTLENTGGMYVYSISVTDGQGGGQGGTTTPGDHSVKLNTARNQARLTTVGNEIKYYDTDDIGSIDIDRQAGTVTVTPRAAGWTDVYTKSVSNIAFSKAAGQGQGGDIQNGDVEITEARGWNESLYVKWNIYAGASSYNVYVRGGKHAGYTKIDAELVRNYGTYGRADVLGLTAGTGYAVKVVPVIGGSEDEGKASVVTGIEVGAYDRSGFAHFNTGGVGAYNTDGTLKTNTRVIYVTSQTAKTVQLDVITGSNEKKETFTGLQAIINAYQKGLETRPLAVRFIGQIKDTDMDAFGSKSEGLQIKGRNNTIPMNITVEGVGDDATVWGFGFLLRNAVSVELRNFAIMLCMDDCVSIDTNNKYCWIHHLDLFYGKTGGDSDQAKGDGTIDVKGNSQYVTISYNHLFDSGKSSLCGMTGESGPNYIDYHHNWFDHSDSRHPRVRTMTVHVWNNYYDGCSKYGVGATMGSSVFVESNYFRHTKNPMLISKQGTDAKGDGTFSGENGGMIKSFGNVYAEKGTGANYTPVTHKASAANFDCYEADTRDEQVPASFKTVAGGTMYDNFDTDSKLIYEYTPLPATDVPAAVTGYYGAGRMNKGDFKWTFDNATADTDYGVVKALKAAIESYKSTLVGWFE